MSNTFTNSALANGSRKYKKSAKNETVSSLTVNNNSNNSKNHNNIGNVFEPMDIDDVQAKRQTGGIVPYQIRDNSTIKSSFGSNGSNTVNTTTNSHLNQQPNELDLTLSRTSLDREVVLAAAQLFQFANQAYRHAAVSNAGGYYLHQSNNSNSSEDMVPRPSAMSLSNLLLPSSSDESGAAAAAASSSQPAKSNYFLTMNIHPETFGIAPTTSAPIEQHGFYPYSQSGGSALGIAGEDYCLVAADTRQSQDSYLIGSRYAPKAFKLTDTSVIAVVGFPADGVSLVKRLQKSIEWYRHNHEKTMSTAAIAQMLSTILYSKRFFPYYIFTILGGLDENGRGVIYSYDPVGSFEPQINRAIGTGAELIQPFLDNQVSFKNMPKAERSRLPLDLALHITKDAFTSATERDTLTGDYLETFIITREGINIERSDLKKD
ncbi:14054_t:CDS:2 [Ambispora leptoticha]|uniref:14054_t:CDS:1 n=1 Tax=Ambispora leptoticha TaxID=144679 RepID=A0A9N8Z554_9GLOM|nr:14054_t:CDS:2 [Ambispora leptoticha]